MDEPTEARLNRLVREQFGATTIFSVGRRATRGPCILAIFGTGEWQLRPVRCRGHRRTRIG